MDAQQSLEYWETQLRHAIDEEQRLRIAINVSVYLGRVGRFPDALATLDRFTPRRPSPLAMAFWLNARAYTLVRLDRAAEAPGHLDDAELLVDESTPLGQSLAGCIVGTRGIALLHLGRLDEAEALLFQALEIGRAAAAGEGRTDGPVAVSESILAGERWFWLAEIATRRGQAQEARTRLMTAANADGDFAKRAADRLGLEQPLGYPQDWDLEWVAIDKRGHVATFNNAGTGPIPTLWLREPSALHRLMAALKALPARADTKLRLDPRTSDDFVPLARRGLHAYDWRDGRYVIQARPTVAARASELVWPEHLKNLVARSTSLALDFSGDTVDVPAVFECLAGQPR